MSLEGGLEQINHCLGFLRIGWGVLFPVEEVSCAERLIVEGRVVWLEYAVFCNFKRALHLSERLLEGRRLLGWLYG